MKVRVMLLTILMVVSAMSITLGPGSQTASAWAPTIQAGGHNYTGSIDITARGYTNASMGTGLIGFDGDDISVGQWWGDFPGWNATINRGVISFNTSTLGNVTVLSAKLRLRVFDITIAAGAPNFSVNVYRLYNQTSTLWGPFPGFWNATTTFQGTICNTSDVAPLDWVEMAVAPSEINRTGWTQYEIKSSRDGIRPLSELQEYITFLNCYMDSVWNGFPYLSLTTAPIDGLPAYFDINTDPRYTANRTLYPIQKLGESASSQIWTYGFMTPRVIGPADYCRITLNSNMSVASVSAFSTYTVTGRYLNITNMWPGVMIYIWLRVDVTNYVTVWLDLYDPIMDRSHGWPAWNTYWSAGALNQSNGTRIPQEHFVLPFSETQTYTVYSTDRYSHVIGQASFIPSAPEIFVTINIPVYEITFSNSCDADIQLRLMDRTNLTAGRTFDLARRSYRWDTLRPANYTLKATWLNGTGSSTWYNFTVSGPTFWRINGTSLAIISTILGNLSTTTAITLSQVSGLGPDIQYKFNNTPYAPTRSVSAISRGGLLYLDPWLMLEASATFQNSGIVTAGTGSRWLGFVPTTMGGSVNILRDELTISVNRSVNIRLNDTTGGVIIRNATINGIQFYDVQALSAASPGHNLTVWTNRSVNMSYKRVVDYRQSRRFTWTLMPQTGLIAAVAYANNTLPVKVDHPTIYMQFPNETENAPVLSTVRLYSQNNDMWLTPGTHFTFSNSGVYWEYGNLTSGESQVVTAQYYRANSTPETTEIYVTPDPLDVRITDRNGVSYEYLSYSYVNHAGVTYIPTVYLLFGNVEAADVDPSSIVVMDPATSQEYVQGVDWLFDGGKVILKSTMIGALVNGQALQYVVLFHRSSVNLGFNIYDSDPYVGLPYFVWILVAAGVALAAGPIMDFVRAKKSKGVVWTRVGMMVCIALILVDCVAMLTGWFG